LEIGTKRLEFEEEEELNLLKLYLSKCLALEYNFEEILGSSASKRWSEY